MPVKGKKMGNKVKAHRVYKNKNGKRVPGTTTITGILNKPALVGWAWNLGMEGIDFRKFKDDLADVGTLAHYLILCDLTKVPEQEKEEQLNEHSPNDLDRAENCVLSFFEWQKGHKIDVILAEIPLVSEDWQFGGTPDCYCILDGKPTLLDFKTGKAIYSEMFYQLGGYCQLLEETNHPIVQAKILRIGRTEDEGFEERTINTGAIKQNKDIFCKLRDLYSLINGK